VIGGCWCNITDLNACVPSGEESEDSKDSFMRNWSRFSITFLNTI